MLEDYDKLGNAAQFSDLPMKLCDNEIELMMARKKLEETLLQKNITNPILFHTFHPDSVKYPKLKEELNYNESEDQY
jgi:hypothetical protein